MFEKNFYIEHPNVTARDVAAADEWRKSKSISIEGRGVPKPVLTFEEASMPDYVLSEVNKQGFKEPSPIQAQGWPMALLGRDMIGISRTGSGKTLAFLLPGMIHINAQPYLQPGDGPIVLTLAPTRELAVTTGAEDGRRWVPRSRFPMNGIASWTRQDQYVERIARRAIFASLLKGASTEGRRRATAGIHMRPRFVDPGPDQGRV